MSKLPRGLSGVEVVRALQRAGFVFRRQTGNHVILTRNEPRAQVAVPRHRSVKPGTLAAILRRADLTIEEFQDLL